MEFHCATNVEVCFNGGICVVDDIIQKSFCQCPDPDFGPDFSWFHDRSCTLPRHFFLGGMIEITIISWIPVLLLLRRIIFSQKGRMKWAGLFSMFGTLSMWLFAVGLYVQHGSFEMAGFFLTSTLLSCCMCAIHLLHLQVSVLRGVDQLIELRLLTRSLNYTNYACMLMSFAIGVAWIVLCRTKTHNLVVLVSFCSIVFWNSMYVCEIVYYSSRLILEISTLQARMVNQIHSSAFLDWDAILARIRNLRTGICIYFATLLFGIMPIIITHLTLGSSPYQFVFLFGALHCPAILSCAVLMLAKHHRKDTQQVSGRRTGDSGTVAAVEVTPQQDMDFKVTGMTPDIQTTA